MCLSSPRRQIYNLNILYYTITSLFAFASVICISQFLMHIIESELVNLAGVKLMQGFIHLHKYWKG